MDSAGVGVGAGCYMLMVDRPVTQSHTSCGETAVGPNGEIN